MTRPLSHAKLPAKAALEREYLAGASFRTLAEKYGVRRGTVYNTMRVRRLKAGEPWPLKKGRPNWEKKKSQAMSARRWDGVTTMMLRLEIADCTAKYKITVKELAHHAGLAESTVVRISSGYSPRVARLTATKLMDAIERVERGHITPTAQYQPRRDTLDGLRRTG